MLALIDPGHARSVSGIRDFVAAIVDQHAAYTAQQGVAASVVPRTEVIQRHSCRALAAGDQREAVRDTRQANETRRRDARPVTERIAVGALGQTHHVLRPKCLLPHNRCNRGPISLQRSTAFGPRPQIAVIVWSVDGAHDSQTWQTSMNERYRDGVTAIAALHGGGAVVRVDDPYVVVTGFGGMGTGFLREALARF